MKTLVDIIHNRAGYWVGDGFPVRSLFSHQGEPIDELVVGYGPFVMNVEAKIREARGFQSRPHWVRWLPPDPGQPGFELRGPAILIRASHSRAPQRK